MDFDLHKKVFSVLVVVTHELSKASPNGLPDPDYNDGLLNFDADIRSAFEQKQTGQTVLIETFGGKRKYYIYVIRNGPGRPVAKSDSRSHRQDYGRLRQRQKSAIFEELDFVKAVEINNIHNLADGCRVYAHGIARNEHSDSNIIQRTTNSNTGFGHDTGH